MSNSQLHTPIFSTNFRKYIKSKILHIENGLEGNMKMHVPQKIHSHNTVYMFSRKATGKTHSVINSEAGRDL